MYQPFERFQAEYIPRLIELNKSFLVSQTYRRSIHQPGILLTDYDDRGLATTHFNALKGDRFAAIIDLKIAKHANKLRELTQPGSPYLLYWAIVRSAAATKKQVDQRFSEQVRQYIKTHTDWRITAAETIKPNLKVIFGELYMILRYGKNHELRVKFEDIEKA